MIQTECITAEEKERFAKVPSGRPDWFMVAAYNSMRGYWSLRKGWWVNLTRARRAAEKLSGVWTHIRIVRIPGEPDRDAAPLVKMLSQPVEMHPESDSSLS